MKPYVLTLIILLFTSSIFAQDLDEWAETSQITIYEKVYLHTDREFYSTGDTIWFKSYLVSGISHKLLPGYKNLYIQLVSSTGEVIANRLLLSIYGQANGDIALNDSLPDGQYILRAKTKYLENFGEESYFHKRILVNKAKSSFELELEEEKLAEEIETMYFPEGGNLVYNAANNVAFKVIAPNGRGIEASGAVINQFNDTITRFKTSFLGMGKFTIMPKQS